MDNVLHSESDGEIHYHIYIPESYDGSEPYALFIRLPGYEGLYFQGMGVNLEAEEFAFEAQKYNENMIVVAPQLEDWGETSADQTIALTRYLLNHYNIDSDRVYANGYSGGGETMSLALEKAPELFTAYLHCSSRWDGDFAPVVENRLPVYLVIGENDEYYGPNLQGKRMRRLRIYIWSRDFRMRKLTDFWSLILKTVRISQSGESAASMEAAHSLPLMRKL